MSESGWITVAKVTRILGVSHNDVGRLIRQGRLHPVRSGSGRGIRVYREDEVRSLVGEDLGLHEDWRRRDASGRFTRKPDDERHRA
jgi:excisionase family DNA binding protein